MNVPEILNLGSGKSFNPQLLNVDIDPYWQPDILYDLNQPFPLESGQAFTTTRFGTIPIRYHSFRHILAVDLLEHVRELTTLMRSCLNLLQIDGILEILVPYDLSYGAWQDPTHLRAFNERSWWYYTKWFWYLGWKDARFEVVDLRFIPSDLGRMLQQKNHPSEEILRTPRAIDSMHVLLKKIHLTDSDRNQLNQFLQKR